VAAGLLVAEQLNATPTPVDVLKGRGDLLSQLVVAPEDTGAHYEREQWHPGWADQGGGCDTRDIVLIDQGEGEVRDGRCHFTCPGGCWFSPYDDHLHSDPGRMDIDHRVPLGEANRSRVVGEDGTVGLGAGRVWTVTEKQAFAEDLDNLVAVTSAVNRAKGDKDPGRWRPPSREERCGYARAYATTKIDWGLTVDQAERDGLAQMLATCPAADPGRTP
jgi:hypothetical protein